MIAAPLGPIRNTVQADAQAARVISSNVHHAQVRALGQLAQATSRRESIIVATLLLATAVNHTQNISFAQSHASWMWM